MAALASADGVVAVIGDTGPFLLYPSAEAPEVVWRRPWPVHMPTGAVAWVRRRVGLSVGRGSAVPRLLVSGDRPSLADDVLRDVARTTGHDGELVGLITAGHAVLRVRTAAGDVAVRLSVTDPDREVDIAARVLREVPEAAPLPPGRRRRRTDRTAGPGSRPSGLPAGAGR